MLGSRLYGYLRNHAKPADHRSLLAGFCRLPLADLDALLDARLVLDARVHRFLTEEVPDLLRTPAKSSVARYEEGINRIRGRPDWQRTVRARMERGGMDAPHYVWRSVNRLYDLPENQLVKHVLRIISVIGRRTADPGGQYRAATFRAEAVGVATRAEHLLGHAVLRGVSAVSAVSDEARSRSNSQRVAGYRSAARLLGFLEGIREHGSSVQLDFLASTYLVPLIDDTVFELFVLSKVIDALIGTGWEVVSLSAVGERSAPVFALRRGEERADVFYQYTPPELSDASHYKQLFDGTGIQVAVRRPDIILRVTGGRSRWITLIEVKFSDHKSYITDGIYKCLGYLRDFSSVLDPQHPAPLALLVCWNGVSSTVSPTPEEVSVATVDRLGATLRVFLEAGAPMRRSAGPASAVPGGTAA